MPIVTLLTDFGLTDPYVGVMKGVILSRCPQARLVDLTHSVNPQDVAGAAFLLGSSYMHFPPRTVHLAVVDPGVGGVRRPLAALIDGHFFVAPDNGLLSHVLAAAREMQIVHLNRPQHFLPQISRTFHGRDIFAPIAGSLAANTSLAAFGTPVMDPIMLPVSAPAVTPARIWAQVIHADRFGNLITDLTEEAFRQWLPQIRLSLTIRAGNAVLQGIRESYSEVAPGEPVALFDSFGRLEIAIREGSAARALGIRPGNIVELVLERGSP
ncbi:MAG: SAM-dependent chlorinase/fluorinase [Armatimonadetes bacterium]|nr:SAM-dependent chlorinase/fluorinase [Armatimonadota bacterium]